MGHYSGVVVEEYALHCVKALLTWRMNLDCLDQFEVVIQFQGTSECMNLPKKFQNLFIADAV